MRVLCPSYIKSHGYNGHLSNYLIYDSYSGLSMAVALCCMETFLWQWYSIMIVITLMFMMFYSCNMWVVSNYRFMVVAVWQQKFSDWKEKKNWLTWVTWISRNFLASLQSVRFSNMFRMSKLLKISRTWMWWISRNILELEQHTSLQFVGFFIRSQY